MKSKNIDGLGCPWIANEKEAGHNPFLKKKARRKKKKLKFM